MRRTQHRTRLLIGSALAAAVVAGCAPAYEHTVDRGTRVEPAAPWDEPTTTTVGGAPGPRPSSD
jgi:hypothetical protein